MQQSLKTGYIVYSKDFKIIGYILELEYKDVFNVHWCVNNSPDKNNLDRMPSSIAWSPEWKADFIIQKFD